MAVEFRDLSQALLDSHAGKYGQTALKNGGFTSMYFDLGTLTSFPKQFGVVADTYAEMVLALPVKPDRLIDVPQRITPFVTAIMERTQIPFIRPQLAQKDHGVMAPFYGEWEPGMRGLVIDDVVTTGGSIIDVVEHSRTHGLIVEDGLILIKRQLKGIDALANIGVELRYKTDVPRLATDWKNHGGMTDEQFETAKLEFNF